MTKVATDLLTPDEIAALMKVCTRPVEWAFIMTLYDGGFLIGEGGTNSVNIHSKKTVVFKKGFRF